MANDGKFLNVTNGDITQEQAIQNSAGAGDANKMLRLDPSGKIDNSFLGTGVGPDVKVLPTFENLSAGDFVNIFNDGGTVKARKADANPNRPAHGFVLAGVTAPANADVYMEGTNTALSGLTLGVQHFLSATAGSSTATAPSASGDIVQKLGVSLSATEIAFEPSNPVLLI